VPLKDLKVFNPFLALFLELLELLIIFLILGKKLLQFSGIVIVGKITDMILKITNFSL